jgi:hypothetical protein
MLNHIKKYVILTNDSGLLECDSVSLDLQFPMIRRDHVILKRREPLTQRHIPEDLNYQLHRCGHLKTRKPQSLSFSLVLKIWRRLLWRRRSVRPSVTNGKSSRLRFSTKMRIPHIIMQFCHSKHKQYVQSKRCSSCRKSTVNSIWR